ncbi:LysR family transcriptional regulator [Pseudomonas sp. N040]|uniref:LysR family transcriptional regulator n=1 Tax=Pseudomonas sp. N040 TaxID=2785325 RepID=UPI0018A306F5|nr:LysR family transcriptional regulator [Pseudomonas sp. N040]MBF7731011.1 LysR family transcriptional regulator [Pseudomonas sp. N040]MBW7014654.1 LysR family transcriptional regulator [Pseudomonas sp. N040]
MDLKRIRHALALAQELNFARAAEKVHLSQPALSRSIQALETELGMVLFDRSKQGLAVTAIGARFLARARQLAQEASNLERDMALTRSGEIGQLSFGIGPLPAASLASRLIHRLRQDRPGLRVSLQVSNSRNLLDHLRNEDIEFFIAETRAIASDAEFRITPLTRERGPFTCRAGHPLLALPARSLQDLLPYGFACMTIPAGLGALLRQAAGLAPDQPLPILFECDDVSLLKEVASKEDLVLIISHAALAKEFAAGELLPLPVPGLPDLYAEVGIVQLRGRTLSPAAQLALATLREMVAPTETVT